MAASTLSMALLGHSGRKFVLSPASVLVRPSVFDGPASQNRKASIFAASKANHMPAAQ